MPSRRQFLAGTATGATRLAWGAAQDESSVLLRTHDWFGDKLERFDFPRGWRVRTYHMKGYQTPVLSTENIRKAILNPVGTKPLVEIAAGKTTAAIAVDDMTRPTPAHDIVPHVVAELNAAGIRDENILFVIGHGAHPMLNAMEVAQKIGQEAVRRHPWINHNCWENLVDLGGTRHKNQVFADTYYYNADVKITISGVKAHGYAGYAGGPKMILPGVCGIKTIRYNHYEIKPASRPRRDPGGVEIIAMHQNEKRQDMIDAARAVGVDFSVQTVYNQDRKLVHVVAGDIVDAHNRAAAYGVNHLATEYAKSADVVVINAYPKGLEPQQDFVWGARGLKEGGSVVLIDQHPMGKAAWHYVEQLVYFQRAGGNYFKHRTMRRKQFPQARQFLWYSQYLQARELDMLDVPAETIGVRTWAEVIERLAREHKGDVEVAVYPYAGIQHGIATLDLPA